MMTEVLGQLSESSELSYIETKVLSCFVSAHLETLIKLCATLKIEEKFTAPMLN